MSSQPIKQKQLGLKKSDTPDYTMNDGFEGSDGKPKPVYEKDDWQGSVKGKTKHTYKGV